MVNRRHHVAEEPLQTTCRPHRLSGLPRHGWALHWEGRARRSHHPAQRHDDAAAAVPDLPGANQVQVSALPGHGLCAAEDGFSPPQSIAACSPLHARFTCTHCSIFFSPSLHTPRLANDARAVPRLEIKTSTRLCTFTACIACVSAPHARRCAPTDYGMAVAAVRWFCYSASALLGPPLAAGSSRCS